MRTDFDMIESDTRVRLFPRPNNPLHKKPIAAFYSPPYFYCDGTPRAEGPDYYLGDVFTFCEGYELAPPQDETQ